MLRSTLALFRGRENQAIVELARRQQLAACVHRHPRPRISPLDRAFWVALSRSLIARMATENGWRARKIQGELAMLGIHIGLTDLRRRHDLLARGRPVDPGIGIHPKKTALHSPWQNGIAERFVGTVRRELLDHIVVLSEDHTRRLLREYVEYCNRERVHTSIRDAPEGRAAQRRPSRRAKVLGIPRVGGLHRRYTWVEAA